MSAALLLPARLDGDELWSACPCCRGLHPLDPSHVPAPPHCQASGLLTQLGRVRIIQIGSDDELLDVADRLLVIYLGFRVALDGCSWEHPIYGEGHGTPDAVDVGRGLLALAEHHFKREVPRC